MDDETREERVRRELADWWMAKAEAEVDATISKAVAYGQVSLEVMGDVLIKQAPEGKRNQSKALQMACLIYAFGKMARAWAALLRGDQPNPDDWFDIGVYARMGQRIQETGKWV